MMRVQEADGGNCPSWRQLRQARDGQIEGRKRKAAFDVDHQAPGRVWLATGTAWPSTLPERAWPA
jgi:hypothetical protein